jgi:uncharacterized membrane protein YphA (DoxX/SURF4 family)
MGRGENPLQTNKLFFLPFLHKASYMNLTPATGWTHTERILFRFSFCYLIFFFIFYSRFFVSNFSFLKYIHAPFEYVSGYFVTFVNNLFFHYRWEDGFETTTGDTSAFIVASFSYLLLSFIITITWTIADKRKNYTKLYSILYIYARYYLAFVLFDYGFAKLTGNQFSELYPEYLIRPLSNYDPSLLLWAFMSASESYKIFTALIEIMAGVMLLFRKTTPLGSLIAILSLTNILALNIGYDVRIKFFLVHIILISLFILSPDIKRLLNFFLLKKNSSLAMIPFPLKLEKLNWLRYILKFGVIIFLIVLMFKNQLITSRKILPDNLTGLYDVKEFHINHQIVPALITDMTRWKKIAINKYGRITIQFMNDSTYQYQSKVHSTNHSIDLIVWNDSTFKSRIYYTIAGSNKYQFEGTFKKDSIKITTQKVDLKSLPINKSKGKVNWVWW